MTGVIHTIVILSLSTFKHVASIVGATFRFNDLMYRVREIKTGQHKIFTI
jgi:hypothetical protein